MQPTRLAGGWRGEWWPGGHTLANLFVMDTFLEQSGECWLDPPDDCNTTDTPLIARVRRT
jgi:hypothetical protein